MKKFMAIITLVLGIFLGTVSADAKTVVSETINHHTIAVTQKKGKTAVKWDGETICKFRFGGKCKIIGEAKLSGRMLRKRKGKTLYIERIVGTVRNGNGDGKTTGGHYISYKSLKCKVRKGDTVVTYCVYNPFTKWIDDVIERYDIIM